MFETIKILVVEDSPIVTKIVRHVVNADSNVEAIYAASFAEARRLLDEQQGTLFAALVDLNLPDAPSGEVVSHTLSLGLPTIVLTGSFDDEKRALLIRKGVVDYVTKEGRYSYQYAVNLIKRLWKNQQVKVLVVDDSEVSRRHLRDLLERHKYQVLDAANGIEAIRILLAEPDIKLLITDYNMPGMDGFELVQNIRVKYEKSDLVIIGLSAESSSSLSAKFIKNGANDFLQKPFNQEEFYCRVMHNVESLELIEQIRDAVNRDMMTGAYNRRYFLQRAAEMYQLAQQRQTPLALAVVTVDHFADIGQRLGHDGADALLKGVAQVLQSALNRFLLARSDNAEFLLALPGLDNEKALSLLEKLRVIISSSCIDVCGEEVYASISGGVTNGLGASLDDMINGARAYCQRATDAGNNMVIGDDEED